MEKYMCYSKKLLPIAALLILQACGGGGDGGSFSNSSLAVGSSSVASSTAASYSLEKINSTAVGVAYTTALSGVDSNAVKYTASVSIENKAQSVVNGVLVTPREYRLSYASVEASVSQENNQVDYRETTSANLVSMLVDGVSCTSTSAYHMPATVKVGDAGIVSSLSCNNNDTQERNWQTEDAGSGNIRIIFTETTKNPVGTVVKIKYYSYVLDSRGNISALKVSENFPVKNYNIIFSGISSTGSTSSSVFASSSAASSVKNSKCDGRTYCSQMTSCAEATYFLQNCPDVEMDGNNDGVPCEKQWCH